MVPRGVMIAKVTIKTKMAFLFKSEADEAKIDQEDQEPPKE